MTVNPDKFKAFVLKKKEQNRQTKRIKLATKMFKSYHQFNY